ncbi:MAG: TonB C-terminal domain-containing protein [Limisphaera sp.]|jgi:protein TonB|nr:TonB C-terminal domain-containing protein [Limisphaera sp.]
MMDRWQRRGLIVSLVLHALLAAVLVFGPAFRARGPSVPDLPILEILPARLVDEPFSGGGQPRAQPPPPAPPVPEPQPPPPRPASQTPVQPSRPTSPPEPSPKPQPTPSARRLPEVSTKLVTRPRATSQAERSVRDAAAEQARREAEAAARARQEALNQALSRLRDLASSGAEVAVPGPGGEAYANYAQYVKTVYTRAWLVPPDLDIEDATVTTSVTIARDGTVVSARIVRGSGHPAVDASVQRTLERVRTIGREFPAGAREDQRTFTIHFNLKAKRLTG